MRWSVSVNEVERVVERYGNLIGHIALHYLHNWADAEDVVQEVVMKWAAKPRRFPDEEYEKAWFIRVTINACKDVLRSAWKKRQVPTEYVEDAGRQSPSNHDLLDAVCALPENYRVVIYLHYYEGFSIREIAFYLKKNENTVQTWHRRAKDLLRGEMTDGLDDLSC